MKNKCALLATMIFLLLLLSACSYKEFEDSLKSKLNKPEEEYINPSKIPDQSPENGNIENENAESGSPELADSVEKTLYSIGDTITLTYPGAGSLQYTLNQINVSENINDLGLNKDDFVDTMPISNNGDVDGDFRLLTLDVTVKNIDFVLLKEDVDKDIPVLPIELAIGFKSGIEDPNGPFSLHASYFSEHQPKDDNGHNQHYFYFPLETGGEMEVAISWFVPTNELRDEPLYYIIGYPVSPEDRKYFKIDLD